MRVLEASRLRVHLGQDTEVRRNPNFRPGGPEGTRPLEEKRQRFLALALQEHPRPLVERAQRVPELKTLFGPICHLFLARRLDLGSEPAAMGEKTRNVNG